MKKTLNVLAVAALSMSLLAGCGNNNNADSSAGSSSSSSKSGKLETLNILYPGDASERMTEFLENEFAEKMAADLNLDVKLTYVPWSQYWENKDIMLAASEPIDLYWDGIPYLSQIVNKKQAQPLDDLLAEYGQNLLKVLPESQFEGGKVDGQIYAIPSAYAPSSAMFQMVTVRQDILEAVGMTEIKTTDDLYEFSKRAAQQFPEMKGAADPVIKPITRYFAEEQYNFIGPEELVVFGEESKKAYSYYETEAFQELIKFGNKMYAEKLYTEDLTIKYNERDTRMQTGLYLWVEGSIGKEMEIYNTVKAAAPDAELKSYLLADEKPRYITATGGEIMVIPYTAKNPTGAMKFLNWLYESQENYLFALYGVEGKDYEIVDGRINKIAANDFFYEWMFRNQNYQVFAPNVEQEAIDQYQNWDNNAIVSDSLGFAFNNENVKQIETALIEVAGKEIAALRTGFLDFDKGYEAAISALKKAGIDEYVAEYQRQLDEFIANK